MQKRKKTNKRKVLNLKLLPMFLLIVVFLLSIGYSAFNIRLLIDDVGLTINPAPDIRITSVTSSGVTSDGELVYLSNDYDSFTTGLNLPYEDSNVTYQVNVLNVGNVKMGILEINTNNPSLIYEITNYTIKEPLCDYNQSCMLGSTSTFDITLKYAPDAYNVSTVSTQDITLDFVFEEIYNVTYVNILSENLPSTTIDTETFSVTIDSVSSIAVTMNSVALIENVDYTFNNNTLSIPNVSGDINISSL